MQNLVFVLLLIEQKYHLAQLPTRISRYVLHWIFWDTYVMLYYSCIYQYFWM